MDELFILEPMKWVDNWPVIGIDKNGDGKGEPVLTYKKPNVGKMYPITTPVESDEFNSNNLGLQWQWMANPQPYWYFTDPAKGVVAFIFCERCPIAPKICGMFQMCFCKNFLRKNLRLQQK